MKFCEKCWSDKVVHTSDLISCKGCGHSKRVLNIVSDHDIDGGLFGKRHQSFVTQKTSKGKLTQNQTAEETGWKQHIVTYQKTLKTAMESFIKHHQIQNDQSTVILFHLKQIWMSYLNRWKELNIPLNSIFTNSFEQQREREGLEPIQQTNSKQDDQNQQLEKRQDSNMDEQPCTRSRRRKSTLDLHQISFDEELIKEQYTDESIEPSTKEQMIKYIRGLTSQITMNTHIYFKKLLKIKNIPSQLIPLISKAYVQRLNYHDFIRKQKPKEILSYIKFKKVYLKKEWLKQQVKNRNQLRFQQIPFEKLLIYIFMFDLIQYKLSIKKKQNKKDLKYLIQKYFRVKKVDNQLINLALNKFRLKANYEGMFAPQSSSNPAGLPPPLNFNLIYSFIHVALLKSQQVHYIPEIINHSTLNQQFWADNIYLKINTCPSILKVRTNSISLIESLKIEFKQSNRGRWIDRISNQLDLNQCNNLLKVMTRTLIVQPGWIVNEDLQCLAIFVIFCKLMVNMDQQQNVALMPLNTILNKYNVLKNSTYSKITLYLEKINKQLPQDFKSSIKLNIRTIISNITISNQQMINKIKFQNVSDLKYLTLDKFLEIKRQDYSVFLQHKSFQKHKQIFSKKQQHVSQNSKCVSIKVSMQQPKRQVQFREYLVNQIPGSMFNRLGQSDVILASNHYQIIKDYRSNYYPLNKNELMQLLGTLSKTRCSIDQLYKKVQQIQKQIILFETQ